MRDLISHYGGFIEVHVATPIEVCEQRNGEDLNAKARAGLVRGFTGIDDPYEAPENSEILIDMSELTAEDAASRVVLYLEKEGYISAVAEQVKEA